MVIILPALLALLGLAEAFAINFWQRSLYGQTALELIYGLVTAGIIFYLAGSRTSRTATRRALAAPAWLDGAVIVAAFVFAVLVAQYALEAFPLSADEYGYNFVADTLLHGRLWNQAYPEPLRDVLESVYIGGHGDQRVSQYTPGWPVFLIPFKLIGLAQLANPVLGLLANVFLFLALRRLAIPRNVRLAALLFAAAAPFTLFNNASFFNHTLTATTLLAIVWLDLRDRAQPPAQAAARAAAQGSAWNRAGIGLSFSILLAVRYEVFLVAFLLFVIDGLWRNRRRLVAWALPAALAAAPLTILFLAYNWAITGSPFTTTQAWVSPNIGYGLHAMGMEGPHSAQRGLVHTLAWFATWQDFAAVILLPLYVVALRIRLSTRTLCWFDVLWPALVVFFFFYPDFGGLQYGPRYWYAGYVVMPVTVAAALPLIGERWQLGRWQIDPLRLAFAQTASFAGFALVFAAFLHVETEYRRTPFRLAAEAHAPAIVLIDDLERRFTRWQHQPYDIHSKDYTRNGLGPLGPIIMGRDLGDARTALLCRQMPDRAVYRVQLDQERPTGTIIPVCNGATAP